MNRNLVRGLAFIGVALFFGVQALTYRLGDLAHAGPGLFPFILSVIVGLIGLSMLIGARMQVALPVHFNVRNIALILGSLVGFALLTEWVGALVGVVFLVFFSGLAGDKYDWKRNVKITAGLMIITYLFAAVLGVSLRLY